MLLPPAPHPSRISSRAHHRARWEVEQGLAGDPHLSDEGNNDDDGVDNKRTSMREAVRINKRRKCFENLGVPGQADVPSVPPAG